MGMASGVFEADMERAKLRQQAANNAATQALNWRKQQLAEREYEDKRKARERDEALDKERYDQRMKLYERELDEKGAREDRKLDYEMWRQDRLDALAERKYALQEAEQQAKYEKQRAIYDGYAQLGKQAKQQQMARQESGATALASVMKLAMGNGGANPKTGKKSKGMVPRYALEALNRDMGFDGQNQGFVSGGYTANGDFFLEYAQKDPQTGQMVTTPQVITPIDQFKIMNKQRGVFTKQDCGEMAAQLKGTGYRDDEIMLASGIDQSQLEQIKKAEKQVQAKKAAGNDDLKTQLETIKMLQEYKAGNLQNLNEATQKSLDEAINNGLMDITQNINQQFLQKKQMQQMREAKDTGLPVYDAQSNTLTLPNGTTLRKNQEWNDPESGNKFVWRGDNAKNFQIYDSSIGKFRETTKDDWAKNVAQAQGDPQIDSNGNFTGTAWKNGVKYQGNALLNEMKKDPKLAQLVNETGDGGMGAIGNMYYEGPAATKEGREKYNAYKLRQQAEERKYGVDSEGNVYDAEDWNREYINLLNNGKLSDDVTYEDFAKLKEQGVDFSQMSLSNAPKALLEEIGRVHNGGGEENRAENMPLDIDEGEPWTEDEKNDARIKAQQAYTQQESEKNNRKIATLRDEDFRKYYSNNAAKINAQVDKTTGRKPDYALQQDFNRWNTEDEAAFESKLNQAKEPSPYVAGEGMSNVNDTSIAGYTKNIYNKLSNSGLLDTSKLGFKDFADLVGMSDEDMAYFDKQKLVSSEPDKQKNISAKKDPNWPPSPDTEMGKKYYQATKAEKDKFWDDVANVDSLYNKFVNNGAIDRNKVGLADFANLMGLSEGDLNDSLKPKLSAREESEAKDKAEYPALSGVENQNTEGEPPLPAHGQYGYNSSEEGEEESYEMPEGMEEYLMSFEE